MLRISFKYNSVIREDLKIILVKNKIKNNIKQRFQ